MNNNSFIVPRSSSTRCSGSSRPDIHPSESRTSASYSNSSRRELSRRRCPGSTWSLAWEESDRSSPRSRCHARNIRRSSIERQRFFRWSSHGRTSTIYPCRTRDTRRTGEVWRSTFRGAAQRRSGWSGCRDWRWRCVPCAECFGPDTLCSASTARTPWWCKEVKVPTNFTLLNTIFRQDDILKDTT